MNNEDVRWKQRFSNFSKAMGHLEKALQIPNPDLVQKAGIIQFFEMSFELAWNMVKDYLEDQGFVDIRSPRGALKKAFETNLWENGHDWMVFYRTEILLPTPMMSRRLQKWNSSSKKVFPCFE